MNKNIIITSVVLFLVISLIGTIYGVSSGIYSLAIPSGVVMGFLIGFTYFIFDKTRHAKIWQLNVMVLGCWLCSCFLIGQVEIYKHILLLINFYLFIFIYNIDKK